MRIGVVGAGGIGGYFGGRLARAGADVHFLARGKHLEALSTRGLRVRSIRGDFELPVEATDDPGAIGPCDLVLFSVKSFDTETAAASLPPLLGEGTGVLTLQNGVDNVEKLVSAIGENHVMAGAAYLIATIAEPGVIEHDAGPGSFAFGELDGTRSERGQRLLEWCERSDIPATLDSDVRVRLWDKFAFICALAGMTAATRKPIGEIRENPDSLAMFRRIVDEVVSLAAAEGVQLSDDTVERHVAFAQQIEPEGTSSLHHDLVHGNRLELEALHGFAVRRAREQGLAVPTCEAVYALLIPWREGADG